MMRLSVFLVVCVFVLCCQGRPDGAPQSACTTLTPVHRGIKPQQTSAPFTVSAVKNGDKIRVRIYSTVGEEFEGFILQARSSKNRNKMVDGKFTQTTDSTKTIDCIRGRENTLTQTSPNPKREIVTEWTPSKDINEDVIFRATVAKTFTHFWTEVDSSSVKMASNGNADKQSRKEYESDNIYRNCFETKGCFGLPSGCIDSQDCEVLLSYTNSADGVSFKMTSFLETDTYMAMGLSTDAQMGDDSVTECVRQGSSIRVRESWNTGKSNSLIKELPRDKYNTDMTDGLSTCSWTTKYLNEANGRKFDLANSTYNLLLAKGPMRNDRLSYHTGKQASRESINFTAFESIEAGGISDSIKIHGTFMVTAWVGLVSLGILLARHFKTSWESKTVCGVKVWFAFHRGLMILALTFIVVAFIVIFVYKDGWNYETSNPHAILGCIATALGLFQPIMATFRPAPDHPKRPIFNWLHWLVGNAAQIIAVITMFFAVSLGSSGLKDSFYWVMSIFVVIHLIFHLLFQVHSWTAGRKKTNDVKMMEMNGSRGSNTQNVPETSLADDAFRVLLLGIYAIFIVVILLALYALIGVA